MPGSRFLAHGVTTQRGRRQRGEELASSTSRPVSDLVSVSCARCHCPLPGQYLAPNPNVGALLRRLRAGTQQPRPIESEIRGQKRHPESGDILIRRAILFAMRCLSRGGILARSVPCAARRCSDPSVCCARLAPAGKTTFLLTNSSFKFVDVRLHRPPPWTAP